MKQKTVFLVALLGLLLAFALGTLYYTAGREEQAAAAVAVNREALVRMHSPTLGPTAAPVVIVEFLDPACETCRDFYPLVKQMLAANPERIRLVLRHAPFHEGSDRVVAVLEAARRQGKFWEALEALLANQSAWTEHHTARVDRVWPFLEGLGLDLDKVRADMAGADVGAVVAQDLADAQTLKVTMTPEFFVNGRPLPSFGYEQLKQLVDEALHAAGAS
jgi:protein-disulfide isomerase